MFEVSLIYQLLALNILIIQANFMADRLGMPEVRINSLEQVRDWGVQPPVLVLSTTRIGLAGFVQTKNLNFGIETENGGHLAGFRIGRLADVPGFGNIEDWDDNGGESGVPKGLINNKEVYLQARSWLEKAGVDVRRLEQECKYSIVHCELPLPKGLVGTGYKVHWKRRHPLKDDPRAGVAAEVFLNAAHKRLVSLSLNALEYWNLPVPRIPHDMAIAQLPPEPVRADFGLRFDDPAKRLFHQPDKPFTNAFTLLSQPPGREAAGRAALYQEAGRILTALRCDQFPRPSDNTVVDVYVDPPAFGSGGRIDYTNGCFQFDVSGRLQEFFCIPAGYTDEWSWLEEAKSRITEAEALQIATRQLAQVGIDTEKLNHDYGLLRVREKAKGWKGPDFPSPLYRFYWTNYDHPPMRAVLDVRVRGDVKQVGGILLRDPALWKMSPVKF